MLSIAKLQNLKAIHNGCCAVEKLVVVVINRKTTKFESNSQHVFPMLWRCLCCYQSQNYKIWKQFTTPLWLSTFRVLLLSIAKLQNLKAIHNAEIIVKWFGFVVINRKTTKFESNSQHYSFVVYLNYCCYQSQNYKIWKQFTTQILLSSSFL